MQSSYQTIAANYLIFHSYDDLPGATRPLSPAADAKTTPPPPHTPTAQLRPMTPSRAREEVSHHHLRPRPMNLLEIKGLQSQIPTGDSGVGILHAVEPL